MIEDAEDYFSKGCGRCARFAMPDCSARKWAAGLAELRRVCLDSGLDETVRWGHPTYACGGRNVAIIGAFRSDFRLSFFDGALMKDPGQVLETAGPNSLRPDMIRFSGVARVAELEPLIRSYLAEARTYAEVGIRAPKDPVEVDLPDELVEALDIRSRPRGRVPGAHARPEAELRHRSDVREDVRDADCADREVPGPRSRRKRREGALRRDGPPVGASEASATGETFCPNRAANISVAEVADRRALGRSQQEEHPR